MLALFSSIEQRVERGFLGGALPDGIVPTHIVTIYVLKWLAYFATRWRGAARDRRAALGKPCQAGKPSYTETEHGKKLTYIRNSW